MYSFVWNDFCDWYLEFTKPIVYADDSPQKQATMKVLAITLNRIMRLLHPFIPFITEELYQKLPIKNEAVIIDAYPTIDNDKMWFSIIDDEAAFELKVLKETISAVRNIRGEALARHAPFVCPTRYARHRTTSRRAHRSERL